MRVRRALLIVAAVGLLGTCAAALVLGGFVVGNYELAPYHWYLHRVNDILFGQFFKRSSPNHRWVETIFLQLERDSGSVPVGRDGTGGGLTSFGDAVVLVTHDGTLFAARSGTQITRTRIEAPDNGFAAYLKAAASERYRGYRHRPEWFRYNDILHYSSPQARGLALSYTEFDPAAECYTNAVAILPVGASVRTVEEITARKSDWDVIYRTRPCLPLKKEFLALEGHMAGGRIAFSAPATIFLASGDYSWDGRSAPGVAYAQDPDKEYGKVIAIDLASRTAKIVSQGHRNMQGIAVDAGGQVWVVEHGMRGGDELNRVVQGADYGWPRETLGTLYTRLPLPGALSYGRHDTFTAPTFAWLPSVATSGLTVIRGFHPSWDGDLLMATLKDQSLYRIRIKDDRVMFAERIPIGNRIRHVHQHTDGRLALWTDERELVFLSVSERNFSNDFVERWMTKVLHDQAQRDKVRAALESCLQCHSLEPQASPGAPSLAGIYGARIAGGNFGDYSDALRRHGGRWSRKELTAFLTDPAAFAPGTRMPKPLVGEPAVIEKLIDLLEELGKGTDFK